MAVERGVLVSVGRAERHRKERHSIVGREFEQVFAVYSLTQPDFLFEGPQSLLAIELKLGAKTSLEQIINTRPCSPSYAPQHRVYSLLFMGPKGLQDLWQEKYASEAEVWAAIAELPLDSLRPKLRRFMGQGQPLLQATSPELQATSPGSVINSAASYQRKISKRSLQ